MKLLELKCKNCGAILNVNSELNEIICTYCGTKLLIDDEATKIEREERAKLNALKEKHDFDMQKMNDTFNLITDFQSKWQEKNKKSVIIGGVSFAVIFLIALLCIIIFG